MIWCYNYTQDESYYLLDADEDEETYVYLGVKNDIDKNAMAADLRKAENGSIQFPAENYVNKVPVNKHDHILIPAGTIHCSGKNTMVLEISATPYIFTFKLWDWGRVDTYIAATEKVDRILYAVISGFIIGIDENKRSSCFVCNSSLQSFFCFSVRLLLRHHPKDCLR